MSTRASLKTLPMLALPALLLAAAIGLAQAAAPEAGRVTAITDAWIFDATGRAPFRGTVLIRDGRIEAVGEKLRVPKRSNIINARGKALLPGLFDLHTHWTPNSEPDATPGIATAYLAGGVTTVNDFHQAPESYESRRQWLATLAAPHVNFAARFSTPLGHGADWADEQTTRWVNTPEAARRELSEVLPYRPDVIKAFTDGWRYGVNPDNTSMNQATLAALVQAAHAANLKVLTHTVSVEPGLLAARAGVDVIAHSLQDRELTTAEIGIIKASGLSYVPTLAVYEPRASRSAGNSAQDLQRERKFGIALYNVKALHDAGVAIASGTDAGMFPHAGATGHELELLVRAGLTPSAALIAGTVNSARSIGLAADRGTIEPGKRADLVLVDGRPWEDIAAIHKVTDTLVDGRVLYTGGKPVLPNTGQAPPPVVVQALVDDFERTDGRSSLDTLRTDEADGGGDRSVQVTTRVPRVDGGHALLVSATLSSKPAPFASVLIPLSRGAVVPADLSGYKGLRLELRGEGVSQSVVLRGVPGSAEWRASVPATTDWKKLELPFGSFVAAAAEEGQPAAMWSGIDITSIGIIAAGNAGQTIWFEVDNVEFY